MDLQKELTEAVRERLKSPFLGTYVLTWCGYNWEAILRLISQTNLEKKIEDIGDLLTISSYLCPIAIATSLMLFVPGINCLLSSITCKFEAKQLEIQEQVSKVRRTLHEDRLTATEQAQGKLALAKAEGELRKLEVFEETPSEGIQGEWVDLDNPNSDETTAHSNS